MAIRTVLIAAGGLLASSLAAPSFADGIEAGEAWARARIPDARAGAAYLTLTNTMETADRLVAGSSPVADIVELHSHTMADGIMKMRKIDAITLPPGETVALEPGGLHVMMIGLKEHLAEGKVFPLTLEFENAPAMTVDVTVAGMAATGPAGANGAHGSHSRHK